MKTAERHDETRGKKRSLTVGQGVGDEAGAVAVVDAAVVVQELVLCRNLPALHVVQCWQSAMAVLSSVTHLQPQLTGGSTTSRPARRGRARRSGA